MKLSKEEIVTFAKEELEYGLAGISRDHLKMLLKVARSMSYRAHEEQKDKFGVDYTLHPIEVAHNTNMIVEARNPHEDTTKYTIVALLHDVVEDSDVTIDEISEIFGEEIAEAINVLTHKPYMSRESYLKYITTNPIAIVVKAADLMHNMNLDRAFKMGIIPSEKDIERTKRYVEEFEMLMGFIRK